MRLPTLSRRSSSETHRPYTSSAQVKRAAQHDGRTRSRRAEDDELLGKLDVLIVGQVVAEVLEAVAVEDEEAVRDAARAPVQQQRALDARLRLKRQSADAPTRE